MGKLGNILVLGTALFFSLSIKAGEFDLTHSEMKDVVKIARAISVVQPKLDEGRYLSYGYGIYRASMKYNIEPSVLISITQQETGFRENLPEGRAGELGICQVLKSWLKNPRFRAEFRNATARDFQKPSKSFQFAAWILSDLKKRITKGSLPYWSYYNANRFHNRFKYFLAVNRYVAALKKNEHRFDDRAVEAELSVVAEAPPAPEPSPLAVKTKVAPKVAPTEASLVPKLKVSKLATEWVPDALKKLRAKFAHRKTDENIVQD